MSGYIIKAPDEATTCLIDWTEGYLGPDEQVVEDLGWSVAPVEGESDALIAAQRLTPKASEARVLRGVPGKVYVLTAEARTDAGRSLSRAIVLRIAGTGPGKH